MSDLKKQDWSESITFQVEFDVRVHKNVIDGWKEAGWDSAGVAQELVSMLGSPVVNVVDARGFSGDEIEEVWGFEPEPIDHG